MAGRGGGRGKPSMSINPEQLGFAKGESIQLPPVLQPPSKYPALEYKAPPFNFGVELPYLLQLKQDFADAMKESPSSVQAVAVKKDIERYSDSLKYMLNDNSSYEQRYNWSRMPAELKPVGSKRKREDPKIEEAKKKKKEMEIERKFRQLEKKENTEHSDEEEQEETKADEEGEEKELDEALEDEEEEADEEMDDGTDYVNNYFDNGENYEDDEENLDDGPIY